MSELKKVMLVDDHQSMRDLFENEFTPESGFKVVDSLGCAADAVVFCQQARPDLIIMDVCTENGASGLDATEKILEAFPEIKVIVTSGFDEITYMPRAKKIGAHAFVYKTKSAEYYREVANQVLAGEYVFPEPKTIPRANGDAPFTDREMEVLTLLCKCMTHQEIADELFISKKTVGKHIENMRDKAAVKSAMDLVIYVLSNGWINPNY